MALGAPRFATPRYSATRGHSVIRQQYGLPVRRPAGMGFHGLHAKSVAPSRGLFNAHIHERPGLRSFRAASEPPIRASIQRSVFSAPPQRRIHHDDLESEFITDLMLSKTTATAHEADDVYHNSRARDRALLKNADYAVSDVYGWNDVTIAPRVIPSHLPPAPRLSHAGVSPHRSNTHMPTPVTTFPVSTPTSHPDFTNFPSRNKSLTMRFADALNDTNTNSHSTISPRDLIKKWTSTPQLNSVYPRTMLSPSVTPRQSPVRTTFVYHDDHALDGDSDAVTSYVPRRKRRRSKKLKRRAMLERWRRRSKVNRWNPNRISEEEASDSDDSDGLMNSDSDTGSDVSPSDDEVALRDYYYSHIPYEPQMPYPTSRRFVSENYPLYSSLCDTYEAPAMSHDSPETSYILHDNNKSILQSPLEPTEIALPDDSFILTTLAERYLPRSCQLYTDFTPGVPLEPTIARCIKSSFKPELRSINLYDSPIDSGDRLAILDFKVPLGRTRHEDISLSAPVAVTFRDSDNFLEQYLARTKEFRDHILRGLDMPTKSRYSGAIGYSNFTGEDSGPRYRPRSRNSYDRSSDVSMYDTPRRSLSHLRDQVLDRPRSVKFREDDDNSTSDALNVIPLSKNFELRRGNRSLALPAPDKMNRDESDSFIFSDNTKNYLGGSTSTTMDRIKLKANASITPVANRRVASRMAVKTHHDSQVDTDLSYISSLYPEYDIATRSRERSVFRSPSPIPIHAPKLGSRAVGARARVNLKRKQFPRRGSPAPVGHRGSPARVGYRASTVPAGYRASTVPAGYRASILPVGYRASRVPVDYVSVLPIRAVVLTHEPPARVQRRMPLSRANSHSGKKAFVSRYETHPGETAAKPPPKFKGRYERKALTQGAREGAKYGNSSKGHVLALVLNHGRRFRSLRDVTSPLNLLFFDNGYDDSTKPYVGYVYRRRSNKSRFPAVRKAEDVPLVIVSDPRTMIRSKNYLIKSETPYEAALLAPTIEIESRRRRTPRSQYGVEKMRQLDLISRDSAAAGLHASAPTARQRRGRKAIRTEEGFTKPSQIWQTRVEAKIAEDDGFYVPASIHTIKDRLREAQAKMDTHRQMLDRYLDNDPKLISSMVESKSPPVTETRTVTRITKVTSPEPEQVDVPKRVGGECSVIAEEGD